MDINRAWELLKAGRIAEGLDQFHANYTERPFFRTLAGLGRAYLYIGQLETAKKYLDEWTQIQTPRSESAYTWAGTCRWLLDEPADACRVWVLGLDCPYRDMAGGLQVPLLLFFASVRHPDVYKKNNAVALIEQRLLSRRAQNWPGPLGQFVTGNLTEQQSSDIASCAPHDSQRVRRLIQVQFYAGVLALADSRRSEFLCQMEKCAALPARDFLPEVTLASYEAKSR